MFNSICNTTRIKYLQKDAMSNKVTANLLLFVTTLFHDLPEVNCLAATNFHDQYVDHPEKRIPETPE